MFIHKGKNKIEMNPKIILENKSFKVQKLTYSIYKTKKKSSSLNLHIYTKHNIVFN
jgi:hypothetical protein